MKISNWRRFLAINGCNSIARVVLERVGNGLAKDLSTPEARSRLDIWVKTKLNHLEVRPLADFSSALTGTRLDGKLWAESRYQLWLWGNTIYVHRYIISYRISLSELIGNFSGDKVLDEKCPDLSVREAIQQLATWKGETFTDSSVFLEIRAITEHIQAYRIPFGSNVASILAGELFFVSVPTQEFLDNIKALDTVI